MPAGRPSDYTKELGDKICALVAEGNSFKKICTNYREEMPDMATIFRWLRVNEEFRKNYEQAIDQRTEAQHEMLLDNGDEAIEEAKTTDPKASNAVVSAYKLKADNMKWVMSRMKPKKYGDKVDITSDGKVLPQPIYGGQSKEQL